MNVVRQVGKNIKKARIDKDISQEALADKLNVSRNHISRLENGVYSFANLQFIYQVAKILEVDFKELFDV